jgi:diguanylate cyclase (GGDEF)-like protein
MAYIDIDNFKSINDTLGHGIGDTVLNEIVRQTQMTLRDTDVIARLGGDEFALLLPETDQAGAQIVIQKIQQNLMAVMQANQWPVTFSIGLATFLSSPGTAEDALKMVDGLMYDVKKTSKNGIKSQQYRMSASSILDPTEKTRS